MKTLLWWEVKSDHVSWTYVADIDDYDYPEVKKVYPKLPDLTLERIAKMFRDEYPEQEVFGTFKPPPLCNAR